MVIVLFGHFLRGRSLKGRCNIRVYVPVCVCVCVFLCVSLRSPPDPAHTVRLNSNNPPHMTPHPRPRIRTHKQLRDLPLGRTTSRRALWVEKAPRNSRFLSLVVVETHPDFPELRRMHLALLSCRHHRLDCLYLYCWHTILEQIGDCICEQRHLLEANMCIFGREASYLNSCQSRFSA